MRRIIEYLKLRWCCHRDNICFKHGTEKVNGTYQISYCRKCADEGYEQRQKEYHRKWNAWQQRSKTTARSWQSYQDTEIK